MSWGERSCKTQNPKCSETFSKYKRCDTGCPAYEWDGKTKPDSDGIDELIDRLLKSPEKKKESHDE